MVINFLKIGHSMENSHDVHILHQVIPEAASLSLWTEPIGYHPSDIRNNSKLELV